MNVNENDREAKAWQFTELLLTRTDFQKDVEDFRQKWQVPKDGFSDDKSRREWERERDYQLVMDFVRSGKYGLNSSSWRPLLTYITTGGTTLPLIGVLPRVTIKVDERTRDPAYYMRFYEHTTEAEIRRAFNSYKSVHLKDTRQQLIRKIKRQKMQRAYELR